MKRLWAIMKKEFRQIRRDPLSLGLLVFIPAFMLVLYGYALSIDVKHIRIGVLDHDRTQTSRQFLDRLFQNPYFVRATTLEREADADVLLRRGQVRAVLVIPRGYAEKLTRGEPAVIQALIDGSDSTAGNVTVGYLDAVAERATRAARAAAGLPPAGGVRIEPRIWFNPELLSSYFLVPGLIGILLMLASVIATSLSIVRERERGTIEQIIVSAVRPWELILGKVLPYVLIGLATMALILCLGYLLFGIAVRGSFVLLGISTLLFLFAALGMGILISSSTTSQQVAFQIATLVSLLPSIILSGLIFPIPNMAPPIQMISLAVPARYFISTMRMIILKDAPAAALGWDWLGLFALGLLFTALAARKTKAWLA